MFNFIPFARARWIVANLDDHSCLIGQTLQLIFPKSVSVSIVPYTQPGFSIDHPMMGLVYLAGAFLGLFAGAALTPRNAGDSTLGLFVLGGALLGVAAGHLLVFMADRFLSIGLVQPIGFGMLGAIVGMIAHRPFAPLVGWNAGIAFIVVGILIGCVFGIMKQTRERRSTEPSRSHLRSNRL